MTKSIKEKTRLINIKKYINNEINFSNDLIKYRLNFHISNIKKSGWAKIFADSDNSPNIKKKEKREKRKDDGNFCLKKLYTQKNLN